MSDHTAGSGHTAYQVRRTPKAEFYLYFGLIFLLALPVAVAGWAWRLLSERRLPALGPFARAWKDAGAITPEIFRH